MWKNYLKLALRNIRRNKVFSLIKIIGLSIGMAVSLIMLIYVVDANNFDKYQKKIFCSQADRLEEHND